jgi:hypothetical protein
VLVDDDLNLVEGDGMVNPSNRCAIGVTQLGCNARILADLLDGAMSKCAIVVADSIIFGTEFKRAGSLIEIAASS